MGHGIIHGYGNGSFGPIDTLTGDLYAKMLLCALDLAREGNYSGGGADWYKVVRKDARAALHTRADGAFKLEHSEGGRADHAPGAQPLGRRRGRHPDAAPTPTPGGDIDLPEVL